MDLQQLLDALNEQTRKVNDLRAENERLRSEITDFHAAGMPTDHMAGVLWIERLIAKCKAVDVWPLLISATLVQFEKLNDGGMYCRNWPEHHESHILFASSDLYENAHICPICLGDVFQETLAALDAAGDS